MCLIANANPHQDEDGVDMPVDSWSCVGCPLNQKDVCNPKKFKQQIASSYIGEEKVYSLCYIITTCSCGRNCALFFHNKRGEHRAWTI